MTGCPRLKQIGALIHRKKLMIIAILRDDNNNSPLEAAAAVPRLQDQEKGRRFR